MTALQEAGKIILKINIFYEMLRFMARLWCRNNFQ